MAKNQDRSKQYIRQVADEIMEQIKAGVAPWQKPWKPGRLLPVLQWRARRAHGREEDRPREAAMRKKP